MRNAEQLPLTYSLHDARVWRERFPLDGRGKRIAGLLQSFTARPLVLRSAEKGLFECARNAVFWESMVFPRLMTRPFEFDIHLSLRESLDRAFGHRIREMMTPKDEYAFRAWIWDGISAALNRPRMPVFWADIRSSIFYPCAFIAHGFYGEAERFYPLIDLWKSGWFPRGTLIDQTVGVLVAA